MSISIGMVRCIVQLDHIIKMDFEESGHFMVLSYGIMGNPKEKSEKWQKTAKMSK